MKVDELHENFEHMFNDKVTIRDQEEQDEQSYLGLGIHRDSNGAN